MSADDTNRPLPYAWADVLRGSVRLMFPLTSLAVLAGLVYSEQGRDVLRALVSVSAVHEGDRSVSGLVFLLAGSAVLSASVWYASRWLLTAQMAALPLPPAGFWQTWLPRVMGFAAPLMLAAGLVALRWRKPELVGDEAFHASAWAGGFAALALVLLLFYWKRGRLMVWLGLDDGAARQRDATGASQPGQIGVEQATPEPTQRVMIWSIALTLAVGALFILFPITLPRMVGAAALAALALASINLFGGFVLTYAPLRHALPPLWIWAVLIAGVLVARCNDNHVVQPARDAGSTVPMLDAVDAFQKHLPADGVVIFVASEGGGIRAAYWTAAVLDALAPAVQQRIRVLSGVSGGSLGVTAWLATHRRDFCADAPGAVGRGVGLRSAAPPALAASTALAADFVAPAVAGMFYGDLMQRFIPAPIGLLDRSRAIEGAWQRAFAHLPGQPFEHTLEAFYAGCPGLPQLVLNATRVETGERVALTLLPTGTGSDMFINTFDAMQPGSVARTQTLAGLVHHSARFPLVSPAGTVPIAKPAAQVPPSFRLVDGGYFDNSGVQSALDAIGALKVRLGPQSFRPLLLVIRNKREPLDRPCPHDAGAIALFPESGSIALALLNVRDSHAITARANAKRLLRDDLIDIVVPEGQAVAPLGWALSAASRGALEEGAGSAVRGVAERIEQRIAGAVTAAAAEVRCSR